MITLERIRDQGSLYETKGSEYKEKRRCCTTRGLWQVNTILGLYGSEKWIEEFLDASSYLLLRSQSTSVMSKGANKASAQLVVCNISLSSF